MSDVEDPEELRRDAAAALAVVVVVVGAVVSFRAADALAPKPSRAQCEQLHAHYVDRASRQHAPGIDDRAVDEAVAAASSDPGRGPDLIACESELTREQVECGLGKGNVDEIERCLQ